MIEQLVLGYLIIGAVTVLLTLHALGGLSRREKVVGVTFYVLLWPLCVLWLLLSGAAVVENWISRRLL